jgi:hypothetical protein
MDAAAKDMPIQPSPAVVASKEGVKAASERFEKEAKEKPVATHGKKKIAKCEGCSKDRAIIGRGYCGGCYYKERKKGFPGQKPPVSRPSMKGRMVHSPEANPTGQQIEPLSDEAVGTPIPSPLYGPVASKPAPEENFQGDLAAVLGDIYEMLLAKNQAYGDSALNPVRVFSKADPVEQLRVRIDDKLSRLMRGKDAGEDTAGDLLGYLVLLKVAERRERKA